MDNVAMFGKRWLIRWQHIFILPPLYFQIKSISKCPHNLVKQRKDVFTVKCWCNPYYDLPLNISEWVKPANRRWQLKEKRGHCSRFCNITLEWPLFCSKSRFQDLTGSSSAVLGSTDPVMCARCCLATERRSMAAAGHGGFWQNIFSI